MTEHRGRHDFMTGTDSNQRRRLREEEFVRAEERLADQMKMKQSAVARYEKARRTPSVRTLWRIAAALGAAIVLGPNRKVVVQDAAETAPSAEGPAPPASLGGSGPPHPRKRGERSA